MKRRDGRMRWHISFPPSSKKNSVCLTTQQTHAVSLSLSHLILTHSTVERKETSESNEMKWMKQCESEWKKEMQRVEVKGFLHKKRVDSERNENVGEERTLQKEASQEIRCRCVRIEYCCCEVFKSVINLEGTNKRFSHPFIPLSSLMSVHNTR